MQSIPVPSTKVQSVAFFFSSEMHQNACKCSASHQNAHYPNENERFFKYQDKKKKKEKGGKKYALGCIKKV